MCRVGEAPAPTPHALGGRSAGSVAEAEAAAAVHDWRGLPAMGFANRGLDRQKLVRALR